MAPSWQADFCRARNALEGKADMPFCTADMCGSIPDLSLTRVRNWTSVQLDFSAHNRDNQNVKFRAGSEAPAHHNEIAHAHVVGAREHAQEARKAHAKV